MQCTYRKSVGLRERRVHPDVYKSVRRHQIRADTTRNSRSDDIDIYLDKLMVKIHLDSHIVTYLVNRVELSWKTLRFNGHKYY